MGNETHPGQIIYKPDGAYHDRTQPRKQAVPEKKNDVNTAPQPPAPKREPQRPVQTEQFRNQGASMTFRQKLSKEDIRQMLIACAVCVTLLIAFFCWLFSPVRRTVRDLERGKYEEAVERYNEELAGDERRQGKVLQEFVSRIVTIQLEFADGKVSAETALEELRILCGISSAPASELASSGITDIRCILAARDAAAAGEHRAAMAEYMLLTQEDTLFELAAAELGTCVDSMILTAREGPLEVQTDLILETIGSLQADGRFPEQVLKLRDCTLELCREHIGQSVECSVPETGIRYIRLALERFPEDEQFATLLTEAIGSYEDYMSEIVELYIEEEEFAQAEELVREAMAGPEALDSFAGLLTRIETARAAFETELRTRVEAAVAAKNFDEAFSLVKQRVEREPENALYQELHKTVLAAQEAHITEQVDGFLANKEFIKAIELAERMLAGYPGSTVYQELKEKSLSAYESSISKRVNAYNADHDYASALSLLDEALKELPDSAAFKQLKTETEQANAAYEEASATFTNADVQFLSYTGSIAEQGEVDSYTFQAPVTGYYRFNTFDMYSGFYVTVSVVDVATGETVERQTYMGNDEGLTAYLYAGKSYRAKVTYYSGTGSYRLRVGQAKATAKITGKSKVYDSIEFVNQRNRYTFTPSVSGYYRFDLRDVKSGFYLSLYIYNELGYEVEARTYLSNNEGVTAHLNKGETYEIVVKYYSGMGSYRMEIGHQQPRMVLQPGTAKTDRISFVDQRNYYNFTPSVSGEHVFALSGMESGVYVSVYVYDALNYTVGYRTYMSSGDKVTAKLTAGEKYSVVVRYYSGLGSYTLNASYG